MDEKQRSGLTAILSDKIRWDCPMERYTTFRVGGNAEAVCFPSNKPLLLRTVSYLHKDTIPYLVVGKGSNLLVKDEGIEGLVIILRGRLSAIEKTGEGNNTLLAGGGLSISKLLSFCGHEGLTGLEFLAGIPGTVGGAVFMNAGAFGKEMGEMVQEVSLLTPRGEEMVMTRSKLEFSYRGSSILKGSVIHRVKFILRKDQKEKIINRITGNINKRKLSQPLDFPSAGSVFKNPPGDYAGRLMEKAGLKGASVGGAMISPKHANYIINKGGAKAKDILELIALAREKVREETGILLEPEIKVVGK